MPSQPSDDLQSTAIRGGAACKHGLGRGLESDSNVATELRACCLRSAGGGRARRMPDALVPEPTV